MNRSDQINELAAALAKAQLAYQPVKKETKNAFYGNKYAELSAVIEAVQPALNANGLAITQIPLVDIENHKAGVETMLTHSSGQWIASEIMLPATSLGKDKSIKFDAQTIGIAFTYSRRYAYQAIAGVAAEADDDANGISNGDVGSKEAAHAVATEKLKAHANGSETVSLTEVAGEMLELGGHGLSIIKAVTSNATKAFLDWVEIGGVVRIPLANKGEFLKLCHLHSVSTISLDAAMHKRPEDLVPLLEASIQQQNGKKANETVTITNYKKGFYALAGPGLPAIRAQLNNQDLGALGWKQEGQVFLISESAIHAFSFLCDKFKVKLEKWFDGKLVEGPVSATLPPFEHAGHELFAGNGDADAPFETVDNSDDPPIEFVRTIPGKNGKKGFFSVGWDGMKLSFFEKHIFDALKPKEGRPAMLQFSEKGQYKNLSAILRLDGVDYTDPQQQLR